MNFLIKSMVISLIMISSGCDSAKGPAQEESTAEENSREKSKQELIDEGYLPGIFIFDDKSKCPVILEIEETKEKLDPVNIQDEKFSALRQEGNTVYIKFRRLRMMNRCTEASPVEIDDLKQR